MRRRSRKGVEEALASKFQPGEGGSNEAEVERGRGARHHDLEYHAQNFLRGTVKVSRWSWEAEYFELSPVRADIATIGRRKKRKA